MPIVFKTEEERNPTNQVIIKEVDQTTVSGDDSEWMEDMTQSVFAEGEEEKLALQYIEETQQYQKFMLWCGLQDQLNKINESLKEQFG